MVGDERVGYEMVAGWRDEKDAWARQTCEVHAGDQIVERVPSQWMSLT